MSDFGQNAYPYETAMLFPDFKRSQDRKRHEEKREDDKRLDEKREADDARDEERRAWDNRFARELYGKRTQEDRKREFEERNPRHYNSMMDKIEHALLRKYVPSMSWKRSDSQGNARNGLFKCLSLKCLVTFYPYSVWAIL